MELKGAENRSFFTITYGMPKGDTAEPFPNQVKVPHYQRPYRWDYENIQKLIDDWQTDRSENNSDNRYFAGAMVTVDRGDRPRHELVDGQQRFTTIFLANFLKFMMLRVLLRQALLWRTYDLSKIFEQLASSANSLFWRPLEGAAPFSEVIKELETDIIKSLESDETDPGLEEPFVQISKKLDFPEELESNPNYTEQHFTNLYHLVDQYELVLKYDRSSFNHALRKALARCGLRINDQEKINLFVHNPDNNESENEKKYVEAITTIFNRFVEKSNAPTPYKHAKEVIEAIDSFLSEIRFCVVQTGNAEDAYTLFEVLNDRSMALDDLDLIKNQFYRKFVRANEGRLSDEEIDGALQQRDEQWVDSIFADVSAAESKLISYLAVSFITGDKDILYNRRERYRNAVSVYLENLDQYVPVDIEEHFNIFEVVRSILDLAGIRFKSKELYALRSEFDANCSVLSKTIFLLIAIGQEGVLAGLTNYTLRYLQDVVPKSPSNNHRLNPNEAKSIIEGILQDNSQGHELQKMARVIWQLSVQYKSAEKPRSYAVSLIESNYLNSPTHSQGTFGMEYDDRDQCFEDWLSSWRYGSDNFRVKLLFSRLLWLSPKEDGTGLRSKTVGFNINRDDVGKLSLDHLEARNPDPSHLEKYFDDPERDFYIEGLGNIMPLPASENATKSNRPLKDSFAIISQSGIGPGHHLYDGTFSIYDDNHDNEGRPTSNFFTSRKNWLKKLFFMAVKYEF